MLRFSVRETPFCKRVLTVPHSIGQSTLHGIGVFAQIDIPKGTIVWEFMHGIDLRFTREQLATFPAHVRTYLNIYGYCCTQSGFFVLEGDHDRFMNHSEDPNIVDKTAENVLLYECSVASRDIAVGEELLCNYASFDAGFSAYGYIDRKPVEWMLEHSPETRSTKTKVSAQRIPVLI